ncbi:hypothetical protein K435DRAFT_601728, partial [Dendrothele bispora CBS 962.96]
LHKSKAAQLDIANEHRHNRLSDTFDIICIQEPYINAIGNIYQGNKWTTIYPTDKFVREKEPTRSVILINKRINTDAWSQLDVHNSKDITAVTVKGIQGEIDIYNIYNDCTHSETIGKLEEHL